MVRAIMVPLDGSSFGEQALPFAVTHARRTGAVLHLAHVHVPLVYTYVGGPPGAFVAPSREYDLEQREYEQRYLGTVRERIQAESRVTVTSVLLDGMVVDTLADYTSSAAIDLIVMTTHGRGPLVRLWLGSVADGLVRHAHVPLLLVRPHEGMRQSELDGMFRSVLVPLDGSALAEEAIDPTLAVADPRETTFTLARVVEPYRTIDAVSLRHILLPDHEDSRRRQAEAEAYLEEVAERMRASGAQVVTLAIIAEHAAPALLAAAQEGGYDLIAMSTHGRGGLNRLVVGSVADKVLRASDCPLLIFRPATTPTGNAEDVAGQEAAASP